MTRMCCLTAELSAARAGATCEHFIVHAESSYEKVDTRWLVALAFEFNR